MSLALSDVSTVERFIAYFKVKGLTDNGIIGALANIYAESGVRCNNLQNSYEKKWNVTDESYVYNVDNGTWTDPINGQPFEFDKGGFGICQWTSCGRKKGMIDYAHEINKSIASEEVNFGWLWYELTHSYRKVLAELINPDATYESCTEVFLCHFEKPASVLKDEKSRQDTITRRVSYAKEFKDMFFKGEKMNKTLAINAGHWNGNAKGVPTYMPVLAGTREFELNNRVVKEVVKQLEGYNMDVVLNYDTTGNDGNQSTNGLDARIKIAEDAKADIYLSIHHNGGIKGGTGGGTVVYYYAGNARNQRQATSIYNNIKARTGLVGNRSTPVKGDKSYIEINKPTMDSFIIECAFMDSKSDIEYIARNEWPAQVAGGIVAFLVSEYGLTKTTKNVKEEDNTSSNIYKVSITSPVAIYEKTDAIAPAGTYTIVGTEAGMGRLKSGAGWICLSNATKG